MEPFNTVSHEVVVLINPRHACAARVIVLCLFVGVCVCYNTPGVSSERNAEISTSTKCKP